ncbi:cupin domain-containing protein [Allosalinactinospora lopnorensis]|uniref:cupin domain-containing protein n=1 Tax=Allosalinactinospora lopnorensis TaxID=1352348 RepID=UPI000623D9C2|nr:cupin domain-containing protein [Allosalinactinospora lopnorensis]
MTVKRLDEVPVAGEEPGIEIRHLKRVRDTELKVLDIEPESATPFHSHPHAHEGVIVAGRGALCLSDRSQLLEPGHVFSVEPYEPHAIHNRGAGKLRLVCVDCFTE